MSLSRAAIVSQLKEIIGADRVITDETVLKKNSIDRFRKFPDIHGIYTLPIPAAVVKLGSTEQVSRVLNFMNAHNTTHTTYRCFRYRRWAGNRCGKLGDTRRLCHESNH